MCPTFQTSFIAQKMTRQNTKWNIQEYTKNAWMCVYCWYVSMLQICEHMPPADMTLARPEGGYRLDTFPCVHTLDW